MPPIDPSASRQFRPKKPKRVVGRGADTTTAPKLKPAAKRAAKPTRHAVVAPDRGDERTARRTEQLKRSKPAAGDAPQRRAEDLKRSEEHVKRQYEAKGRYKQFYRPGTTVPPKIAIKAVLRRKVAEKTKKAIAANAPVLDVLEETTRPLHAIAGASDAALKGENVPKAALKGIKNETRTTFSDVLKTAGVKNKTVRGIAGFGLDVAADPITYVSFGTGSVARKAAEKAARDAAEKATKAGLTPAQAARFGERARRQAEKRAGEARGVSVRVAGREVPGVRSATAKAAKPVRAAGRKAAPRRVREGARAVGADVNPNIRPAGVSRSVSDEATRATRTARAKSNRGLHAAQQQAEGIRRTIGPANYQKVIDALESGHLKSLSPELREAAVKVRSQFRYANRLRKQAGIRGGERRNYVPHQLTEEAREATGRGKAGVGRRVVRPASSRARTEQRSLAQLRRAEPGKYSEDLPSLYANRMAEGSTAAARAELNRRLADLGRGVKKGEDLSLAKGESVYHVVGSDLKRVTDQKELARLVDQGGKTGRYVVLNDDIVKRAVEGAQPTLQGPGIVRGLDKVQAGFKTVALATPGYHVRNLVGDTQMAYLAQKGRRLPRNMKDAARVLAAEGRQDKALRSMAKPTDKKATLKTKRYGEVTYEEVARRLSEVGAMRSGFTAREIPELAGQRTTLRRIRAPRKVKQALLNREDLPRISTAVDVLRRGATWEEAAQRVADKHIDYGHLTQFERQVARRAAPFYTFTARNIPIQAKAFVSKPGKFANFQKLREEATKHAGMDEESQKAKALTDQLKQAGVKLPDGWESLMSEYEQRNAGIPVSYKGAKFTVSFGFPLSDLAQVPGAAGSKQPEEWFKKAMSMVTPIAKNPVEYFNNYSFFFRDQIERDNSPLVSAPTYVSKLPEGLRKDLRIAKRIDKRTGETVWAWPGKLDYIAKMVPGLPAFAQKMMTEGESRRGKGKENEALQFAGVRAEPFDPVREATNLAYARMQEIQKKQAELKQQPHPGNGFAINAQNPTPEYRKLADQLKIVQRVAFEGKDEQGYRVMPKQGGPPKIRVKRGFDFGGGEQDFDFSGGTQDFDFSG